AAECPGRHEFSQLVTDHVFGDVDGHVPPPIVHRDGVPHKFGEDGRVPGPGLDHPLVPRLVHLPNLFQQTRMGVRPFLARPAHGQPPPTPAYLRRRTIRSLDFLFFLRVRAPRVGLPQGVTGPGLPMGALPSPPPWGWSTGFMATPRVWGRRPSHRMRPALPMTMFSCSGLPTWPTVARHSTRTLRNSP